MEQKQERMPLDRWLIQESLQKVQQGPQALMLWAKENAALVDQKFMNQLHKMVEYSRQNKETQRAQTLEFLERCFQKMFPLEAVVEPIAITQENFQANYDQAISYLKNGKAPYSIPLFEALLVFLGRIPNATWESTLHSNLGVAYAQVKLFDKAIHHLEKALAFPLSDEIRSKVYANLSCTYRDYQKFMQG